MWQLRLPTNIWMHEKCRLEIHSEINAGSESDSGWLPSWQRNTRSLPKGALRFFFTDSFELHVKKQYQIFPTTDVQQVDLHHAFKCFKHPKSTILCRCIVIGRLIQTSGRSMVTWFSLDLLLLFVGICSAWSPLKDFEIHHRFGPRLDPQRQTIDWELMVNVCPRWLTGHSSLVYLRICG